MFWTDFYFVFDGGWITFPIAPLRQDAMKIRNKHLIRAAGWAGTRFALGLIRTLRFEFRCVGTVVAPVTAIPYFSSGSMML